MDMLAAFKHFPVNGKHIELYIVLQFSKIAFWLIHTFSLASFLAN